MVSRHWDCVGRLEGVCVVSVPERQCRRGPGYGVAQSSLQKCRPVMAVSLRARGDGEGKCRLGTGATSAPVQERAIDLDLPNHGISINRVELFGDYRGGRLKPAMGIGSHGGTLGRVNHLELGSLRPSRAIFASTEDAVETGGASPWVIALGEEHDSVAALHGVPDGNYRSPSPAHPGRGGFYHVQPVTALELTGSLPSLPLSSGRAGGDGDTMLARLLLGEPFLLFGHVFLGGAHDGFHLVDTTCKGLLESDGSFCECISLCELPGNIAFCEIGGFIGRSVQRVFYRVWKGVLPESVQVIFELFNRPHICYNFEQKLHLHVDFNTVTH
jgi:hypothetical protein